MKSIIINNIQVFDSDSNKTPLLFVHAFPLSSKMWQAQIDTFGSQFRVITYDVRGLGKSLQKNNQFMMEHYANDLIDIITNLKLENVNAVGLSMGGYILQRSLIKNNNIFRTLTLADTRLERDTNEGLALRASAINKILSGQRDEFIKDFIKNLISNESYKNPDLLKTIENIISDNTNEGIAGAMLALATRGDNTGAFNEISTPVLAIVGEFDKLTPIESAIRIKDEFKNSELQIINNSGHLSNMENPTAFNTTLNNFLLKHNE